MRALPLVAAIGLALTAAGCAAPPEQRVLEFSAVLDGAQEVPPTNSPGTGQASISFDRATRQLNWRVDYQGLSGPVQGAHFHGPAGPGENARVQVPIPVSFSPMVGSAILNEDQVQYLLSGRMYVNLHTPRFPNGEIRGQVRAGPLAMVPRPQPYPAPAYQGQPGYAPPPGYPPSAYPSQPAYPPPSSYPSQPAYPPPRPGY